MIQSLWSFTRPHWLPLVLLGSLSVGLNNQNLAMGDEPNGAKTPIVAVQVDVSEFAKSNLGKLLVKAGVSLAAEEMDKDPDEAMAAVVESIGFDPIEQEIKVSTSIVDLEDPINGLELDIQLKDSTGNLEGLLLAAPEYQATTHDGHTIHSASMDGQNVYAAFYTGASGKKHITLAGSEAVIKKTLGNVGSEPASQSNRHTMTKGEMLNVRLMSMPEEIADVPPIANIGKLVDEFAVTLREDENHLVTKVMLNATSEEQATQIQQLAQGAVAMLGLFKEEIRNELGDEVFANNVVPILNQIKVGREGTSVTIETRIPEALVIEFLREEADLPL